MQDNTYLTKKMDPLDSPLTSISPNDAQNYYYFDTCTTITRSMFVLISAQANERSSSDEIEHAFLLVWFRRGIASITTRGGQTGGMYV